MEIPVKPWGPRLMVDVKHYHGETMATSMCAGVMPGPIKEQNVTTEATTRDRDNRARIRNQAHDLYWALFTRLGLRGCPLARHRLVIRALERAGKGLYDQFADALPGMLGSASREWKQFTDNIGNAI